MCIRDRNSDDVRQPWEAPVAGASVMLDGIMATTTSSTGRFAVYAIEAGPHTVTVWDPQGQRPLTTELSITPDRGEVVGINIALEPVATNTPTPTATPTATPVATNTATPTNTPTMTATPVATDTATPTSPLLIHTGAN